MCAAFTSSFGGHSPSFDLGCRLEVIAATGRLGRGSTCQRRKTGSSQRVEPGDWLTVLVREQVAVASTARRDARNQEMGQTSATLHSLILLTAKLFVGFPPPVPQFYVLFLPLFLSKYHTLLAAISITLILAFHYI